MTVLRIVVVVVDAFVVDAFVVAFVNKDDSKGGSDAVFLMVTVATTTGFGTDGLGDPFLTPTTGMPSLLP
jgi:hypothetical protein